MRAPPPPARHGCAFAEFEGAWRAAQAQAKAARQAAAQAVDAYLLLTGPGDAQGPGGTDDEADGLGGESWAASWSAHKRWSIAVPKSSLCHVTLQQALHWAQTHALSCL